MIQIPIERREEAIPEGYVKVVRCKDCKYLYNDDDNDDDCPLRDYFWHNEEDYCSYGERREDDGHNNS